MCYRGTLFLYSLLTCSKEAYFSVQHFGFGLDEIRDWLFLGFFLGSCCCGRQLGFWSFG